MTSFLDQRTADLHCTCCGRDRAELFPMLV